MFSKVDISRIEYFSGACEKLSYQTAVLSVSLDVPVSNFHLQKTRIRSFVQKLRSVDALTNTPAECWPEAFLLSQHTNGGFGEWMVALSVAIQRWARDPVPQGRVFAQTDQVCKLAIPWQRREICDGALQWAAGYLLLWTLPTLAPEAERAFNQNFDQWLSTAQQGGLSPSSTRFALSAISKGLPVAVIDGIVKIGWGAGARHLDGTFTDKTSLLGTVIARQKFKTIQILAKAGLPVPFCSLATSWSEALILAQKIGWPVVIKPSNQDQGLAVVADINNEILLKQSFELANQYSPGAVIVEKHIAGDDHRMLVVGGKLFAVAKRIPAGVTGNGFDSIEQLVKIENKNPLRGQDVRSPMIKLSLDELVLTYLAQSGFTQYSVPVKDCFVRLSRTANISTGGTSVDVTPFVHPDNKILAERAARLIGLDIAGVDFICPDISISWKDSLTGICEVNAQPGLRPHWLADPERDVSGEILDKLMLGINPRIPTAAITGTNGKSTTARMLHHIWMVSGKLAGVNTTQGVWIGHDNVSTDNLSGQPGAAILLQDSAIEAAVIEMPRKGLLCFGHPCDRYDVAALLNVEDDHIGVNGIETLEQMAELKSQVLERATRAVVINAEDALCLKMREKASAPRHILVARDGNNAAINLHTAGGGDAVFIQDINDSPWLIFARGKVLTPIIQLSDIPATLGGLLRFNQTNALFAAALAWSQDLKLTDIINGLGSFYNSPEQNPGRYNFIEDLPFTVLVDFAHNSNNLRELFHVVKLLKPNYARCILVSTVGNRHRHQFEQVCSWYVATFDQIYLSQFKDEFYAGAHGYVGSDPFIAMLSFAETQMRPLLSADQTLATFTDYALALSTALDNCRPGDLLVMLAYPEHAFQAIQKFKNLNKCI
jgi:cyanophycin synthetase